jgi:hypothetical protein
MVAMVLLVVPLGGLLLAFASRRLPSSVAAVIGSVSGPRDEALAPRRERQGGMDVTFLVTADTHFGYRVPAPEEGAPPRSAHDALGIERTHLEAIAAMNRLPGTPYPEAIGGKVGTPLGVLVAGDLTEDGKPREWERFVLYYGHQGKDGLLDYPVFESIGNHDKHYGWYVKERVAERHGGVRYAWDWHDLRVFCLGEAPDDEDLAWLGSEIEALGRERPVVLYFHFPLAGPFSRRHWFGDGDYRDKLWRVIDDVPVVGIFHGHFHGTGLYKWNGIDVYNVGAAKHDVLSFGVVHLTDRRMTVASYHYGRRRFDWWHDKPLFGAQGRERRWVGPGVYRYD